MLNTAIRTPEERKKLIWAIVLGFIAIVFLWWTFFGFGDSSKSTRSAVNSNQARQRSEPNNPASRREDEFKPTPLEQLVPVVMSQTHASVGDARRNIFAFYEKPEKPTPTPPTPTPTPSPPVLLAAVSPSNVYARTEDFTLEVTGDKFTPELRITIDGRELPTRIRSTQQMSATVPASIITNPGSRQVVLRSSDGRLYSNPATININQAPAPNFSYIGIIGITKGRIDTAILQDKSSREIVGAQRGDVLGGRFRLTSISDTQVVLVDTNLKIPYTLEMSTERERGLGPQLRPTPRVESEDDEP